MSYDQWKTASPYDDYDDSACVTCNGKINHDLDTMFTDDGFCSLACYNNEIVPDNACCREMFNVLSHDLGDNPARWSKEVFKGTSCGAWLKIVAIDMIELGSIVEGIDAECQTVLLTMPFTRERLWSALRDIEVDAEELRMDNENA